MDVEFLNCEKSFNCTVVVSSCDKYSDLWLPFFQLFERYWADCCFETILITEKKSFSFNNIKVLNLGENLDWSELLLSALDLIKTKYVILILDDFFLRSKVDNGKILDFLMLVQSHDIEMLRLLPRPAPKLKLRNNSSFGRIEINEPYRVSTQAAIWKYEVLKSLLLKGENAWEFEINGSHRSNHFNNFFSCYHHHFPYYHHVIQAGQWFPWEVLYFSLLKIDIDLSQRQIMSFNHCFIWLLKKVFGPFKRRIQQLFVFLLISGLFENSFTFCF